MEKRIVKYEVSVLVEGDGAVGGLCEIVHDEIRQAILRTEKEYPLFASIGVTASLESVALTDDDGVSCDGFNLTNQ